MNADEMLSSRDENPRFFIRRSVSKLGANRLRHRWNLVQRRRQMAGAVNSMHRHSGKRPGTLSCTSPFSMAGQLLGVSEKGARLHCAKGYLHPRSLSLRTSLQSHFI